MRYRNSLLVLCFILTAACGGSGSGPVAASTASKDLIPDERALVAACEKDGDTPQTCKCFIDTTKSTLSDADYQAFLRLALSAIGAAASMEALGGGMSADDEIVDSGKDFAAQAAIASELLTDPAQAERAPRITEAVNAATEKCSAS